MKTLETWIEDPEDRREFLRRLGIVGLCAGGVAIGIPTYTSIVANR